MASGQSQFIGAAGQYYLSYGLAVRQINASITIGNAPSVDVLASSPDGKYTISFQVKTSRNSYRSSRYGEEGYEWDVNRGVIGKHRESFIYAFVNLQESEEGWNPKIFFVPSIWVAKFVKPDWSRFMYFLPKAVEDITLERWDIISKYLEGDKDAIEWANNWPEDRLVKWGTGTE